MKSISLTTIILGFLTLSYGQQIDKKIFNAFKQGNVNEGGNCVSIALIKAAFSKYGFDHVFKKVDENDGVFSVTMRDDLVVTFSKDDLKVVSDRANFKLKDSTEFSVKFKKYAEFCFTAMCKKAQLLGNYLTLDSAIADLNDGYTTKYSNELLGLKFKRIKPKRANKIDDLEHLVIYNTYHAVFASNGYYDECWNESGIEKVRNLKWKRFGWKCAWKMCSISGAYMVVD